MSAHRLVNFNFLQGKCNEHRLFFAFLRSTTAPPRGVLREPSIGGRMLLMKTPS
jgi:hypothetical protein